MIRHETIMLNGRSLTRTWSDNGFKIERNGVYYDSAIDPADAERVYEETGIPLEVEEITESVLANEAMNLLEAAL